MADKKILIIIPTYNERENIVLLIPQIRRRLPQAHMLVVDDNSPDGTGECVKTLAQTIEGLFLLERQKKEGLGKAYISGFSWALEREYEFIFEMDADFSHDPLYLPDFMAAAETADLVIGSRYKQGVNVINWPMSRLLLSFGANMLVTFVTGLPLKDATAGYKCFRRRVLESIDFSKVGSSGYSFQIEVNFFAWKKGFRISEIPIVFTDRQRGVSKMSTKIIREGLLLVWKLRLLSLFRKDSGR